MFRILLLFSLIITSLNAQTIRLKPGEHKMVVTREVKRFIYDLYLPTKYAKNKQLPIFYTFHWNKKGLVNEYKKTAEKLGVILVGNLRSGSGSDNFRQTRADVYAMMIDLRHRLEFDGSRQYTIGFNGGAVSAYLCARRNRQHIRGVISDSGWIGPAKANSFERWSSNLYALTLAGEKDSSVINWIPNDQVKLNPYDGKIDLFSYPHDGHRRVAPEYIQAKAITKMLNVTENLKGEQKLLELYQKRSKAFKAEDNLKSSFKLAINTVTKYPYTKLAHLARKELDKILLDDRFLELELNLHDRSLNFNTIDFLGQNFLGAALSGDKKRAQSYLHCILSSNILEDNIWANEIFATVLFAGGGRQFSNEACFKVYEKMPSYAQEDQLNQLYYAACLFRAKESDKLKKHLSKIRGLNWNSNIRARCFNDLNNNFNNEIDNLDTKLWMENILY